MKVSTIKVKGGCQKSFSHLLITLLLPGTVPQQGTKYSALHGSRVRSPPDPLRKLPRRLRDFTRVLTWSATLLSDRPTGHQRCLSLLGGCVHPEDEDPQVILPWDGGRVGGPQPGFGITFWEFQWEVTNAIWVIFSVDQVGFHSGSSSFIDCFHGYHLWN